MGNHQEDTLQSRLLNSNEFQQLRKRFLLSKLGRIFQSQRNDDGRKSEDLGEIWRRLRNISRISSSSMEQFHSRDSRTGQRCVTPRENVWKMDRHLHDKE